MPLATNQMNGSSILSTHAISFSNSMVECRPYKTEVVGSSPTGTTVSIVLAVSTKDCGSFRMGSNPIGHTIGY